MVVYFYVIVCVCVCKLLLLARASICLSTRVLQDNGYSVEGVAYNCALYCTTDPRMKPVMNVHSACPLFLGLYLYTNMIRRDDTATPPTFRKKWFYTPLPLQSFDTPLHLLKSSTICPLQILYKLSDTPL